MVSKNKYDPIHGTMAIKDYLEHALEKGKNVKVQKQFNSINQFEREVKEILDCNLKEKLNLKDTIMGFDLLELLQEEEQAGIKFEILEKLITYDYKQIEEGK